jgi:predicted RNA-binding protein YlqC (UPF0109 family)
VKELVELIAKALVDQPDRVQVSLLEGEQTTISSGRPRTSAR